MTTNCLFDERLITDHWQCLWRHCKSSPSSFNVEQCQAAADTETIQSDISGDRTAIIYIDDYHCLFLQLSQKVDIHFTITRRAKGWGLQ